MPGRQHQFLFVQRERVRAPVLSPDDVKAVIVAVGLAVQREKPRRFLHPFPHRRLHQPMPEIQQQHRVGLSDLFLDAGEHLLLHGSRGRVGINVIDGKELAHLLALAQRLHKPLLDHRGEPVLPHHAIRLRLQLVAQLPRHPGFSAHQADEPDPRDELPDVAVGREGPSALRFLAQEPARNDPVLGGQTLDGDVGVPVENRVADDQDSQRRQALHRRVKIAPRELGRQTAAELLHRHAQMVEVLVEQTGRTVLHPANVANFAATFRHRLNLLAQPAGDIEVRVLVFLAFAVVTRADARNRLRGAGERHQDHVVHTRERGHAAEAQLFI